MIYKNKIEHFDGTCGRVVLCVAGWSTGSKLFEYVFQQWTRIVVTPLYPETVVSEMRSWIQQLGFGVDLIVGVSMGVAVAVDYAVASDSTCPLIGLGIMTPISKSTGDDIERLIERSSDGYLRSFWAQCVSDSSERSWMVQVGREAFWRHEDLVAGLIYLQRPFPTVEGRFLMRLIHGDQDLISDVGAVRLLATTHNIRLDVLPGCGHIPLGPSSHSMFEKVIHELEI